TKELSASGCFDGFNIIDVPEGEEAAANALRFNDTVFLSAGHPKSEDLLDQRGYTVIPIPTSQAALVDGGLSCMSLRYST
ncbi:MAG: dimethylarginine dimethylaminohydrolase, partial [Sneathiella sp.]